MLKYSIIIPFYNVEDYIIDCVKSIRAQKYTNFEALFVDDGSKDGSRKKLEKYLKENPDKRIKILNKKNGGLSDARNFGIKNSKGKYIFFIDSDDFVDYNLIEKIDCKIKEKDYDIIIFDFYEYYDENKKILRKGILDNENLEYKNNLLISPPAAWNKVYKRDLFIKNKIEYPLGLWYEDLATTPRLILNSDKILYINEPMYYYRQRQGSIMNTFNNKILDMYKSLDIVYDYYSKNNKMNLYKEEIERMFIFNCYFIVMMYAKNKAENKIKKQKEVIKFLNSRFNFWYKNKYFQNYKLTSKINMLVMKYPKLLFIYNIRGVL